MSKRLLSERLKYLISLKEQNGIKVTNAELSRVAKTSRASVGYWLVDTNGISAEAARALGTYFEANPVWIETGEGDPFETNTQTESQSQSKRLVDLTDSKEFVTVKRVDFKLSAGISGYSVEFLSGDKTPIVFRRDWVESKGLDPDKLYAIRVSGHSMETSLYEGDLVVINVQDTNMRDGEVFAVNYEGELVVKRLIRQAGQWYLSSDNSDKRKYSDKICNEDCILIGRVVYKQSERI
jgi:phage repressor protein C with HTH and peptisase S24 domain